MRGGIANYYAQAGLRIQLRMVNIWIMSILTTLPAHCGTMTTQFVSLHHLPKTLPHLLTNVFFFSYADITAENVFQGQAGTTSNPILDPALDFG